MPRLIAAAVVLVAAAAAAGLALVALVLPRAAAPSRATTPDRGSASTFGRPAGFDVEVGEVHLLDPAGRVTMTVTFRNTSSSQQRADPLDFEIRDASGATSRPVFDAGCPRWARTDLHPAGGAGQSPRDPEAQQVATAFGPVPLCFSVAHPGAGMTLVWNPDIGLLGTPVAIPLR